MPRVKAERGEGIIPPERLAGTPSRPGQIETVSGRLPAAIHSPFSTLPNLTYPWQPEKSHCWGCGFVSLRQKFVGKPYVATH